MNLYRTINVCILLCACLFATPLEAAMRGRPQLNAVRTTFVADNGRPLRGPYESTEWTSAAPYAEIAKIKDLGLNAVHLYAEVFDPNYPAAGSTAPGYAAAEVDKMVQMTRDLGLYLVMTIGNGANNGNHNLQWATNFWNFYAPRYANETHVIYEIHNEPMAWGPSYLTGTSPAGTLNMEIAAYKTIRAQAPNTPVLLFTYAVLSGNGGASAALNDIRAFNQDIFGTADAVWTNEAVAFHGYGGWDGTIAAVLALLSAGYPCFMTEFGWPDWGRTRGVSLEVEVTSDLERLGVSWLTFQYIPPSGVSDDVTRPELFKIPVENAGLSWTPDYGTWPPARGVYGNGGQARATVANWVNNFLTGTARIQAEDFDTGGEGIACHDTDSANTGGQYRASEPVDIGTCNDTGGGYKVTGTANGEWLEYTILVREPGMYNLALRYTTTNSDCTFAVLSNSRDRSEVRTLPRTANTSTWATANVQVYLEFGRQKLRLEIPRGGFDINWMELSPASTGVIANGNYKFLNTANTLAMLAQTSTNNVIATNYTGSPLQQWNLQHMGGGQYKVTSVGNGRVWNASGESLTLASSWNTSNERCIIILPSGPNSYRFVPVGSGLSIGQGSGSTPVVNPAEYDGLNGQHWAILAPLAPQFPAGLTATATSATQASLAWNPVAGVTSYNVKRSMKSGGPFSTVASGVSSTSYVDTGLTTGFIYYYVVSAVSGSTESLDSLEAGVMPPWQWQDLGSTSITGNTTYSNGVFAVTASGSDIWGTADAFRFSYVPANGNCTVIARVASVQNTDPWAKAGVMIRANLAPNAPHAIVAVSPGNGVAFQYRTTSGGSSGGSANASGLVAPYWVKLVRSGNTFTGYRSPNGVDWTQQGTTTISMGASVYVGLALTSHNNSQACAATFDNVSVPNWSTAPAPAAPGGVAAFAVSSIQINAQWNASSNAASYNIKRSETPGGPYTTIATGVVRTNFSDSGLPPGTTYHYVISAVNAAGESTNSVQASATTWPLALGALVHRYSFAETGGSIVSDSIGGPDWNGALPASGNFSAGQLTLASNLQQYVTLPAGIVSTLNDFTVETWVRLNSTANWTRIFDFGDSTTVNMFLTSRNGSDGKVRFAITTGGAAGEQQINTTAALGVNVRHHIAITLKENTGTVYVDGLPVGTNVLTLKPSSLGMTANNYVGRSQYPDPYFNGAVDEFRIYTMALSPGEIAATDALGPNQLLSTDNPSIGIVGATATSVTLAWPLASAGYTLQSRTNLAGGDWQNITFPGPQMAGGQWEVTLPMDTHHPAVFYRLVK